MTTLTLLQDVQKFFIQLLLRSDTKTIANTYLTENITNNFSLKYLIEPQNSIITAQCSGIKYGQYNRLVLHQFRCTNRSLNFDCLLRSFKNLLEKTNSTLVCGMIRRMSLPFALIYCQANTILEKSVLYDTL